eukprot:2416597-Rhodomonas_salina.1
MTLLVLSLNTVFVPPAYKTAVARRKFLGALCTVYYAYKQCAVPTALPLSHATSTARLRLARSVPSARVYLPTPRSRRTHRICSVQNSREGHRHGENSHDLPRVGPGLSPPLSWACLNNDLYALGTRRSGLRGSPVFRRSLAGKVDFVMVSQLIAVSVVLTGVAARGKHPPNLPSPLLIGCASVIKGKAFGADYHCAKV